MQTMYTLVQTDNHTNTSSLIFYRPANTVKALKTYWLHTAYMLKQWEFVFQRSRYTAVASVLWCCWMSGRKGIQPVKTERWGAAWLSVWSEMQTCIWPSWSHCHSLSLASVKSRLALPFWYRLTRVVPDKGPLNGCVCFTVYRRLYCSSLSSLSNTHTHTHTPV